MEIRELYRFAKQPKEEELFIRPSPPPPPPPRPLYIGKLDRGTTLQQYYSHKRCLIWIYTVCPLALEFSV